MKTEKLTVLKPFESMNPIYLGNGSNLYNDIIEEHGGTTCAEIKEDGYRMQVHKKGEEIKAFTRSLNPINLELFPEIKDSLNRLPDCILDSELAGSSKVGISGFSDVKKRFRSKIGRESLTEYLESDLIKKHPLHLRVFDTLYWEDRELSGLPLTERRKYTEKLDEKKITPSQQRIISKPDEIEEWFSWLTNNKYEGLVCKKPDSSYLFGKRTHDWIKIKRAELLDLAVVGAYTENGEISQLLCATKNYTGQYETIAKVNANREGMHETLTSMLKDNLTKIKPKKLILNPSIEKDSKNRPNYFINPINTVVEVAAMNFNYGKNWHSCGLRDEKSYSLRIGWLKRIRDDKRIDQITRSDEIKTLYNLEREN